MSNAKNWCFTLNNYTVEDELRLSGLVENGSCVYLLYGREVGEENQTPHLQGHISFERRVRFARVRSVLGGNPHVEVVRNVVASVAYCKKDGDYDEFGESPDGQGTRSDLEAFKEAVKAGMIQLDQIREEHSKVYAKYTRFCIEYVQDNYPAKVIDTHDLHPWQSDLVEMLNGEPDDRTIVFLVDTVGNVGKSWFSHWYTQENDRCQVLLPGKKADMAYALDQTVRVLFIDAPRSKQGDFIQYDFLEDVKNGYVFSTKYESRVKTLSRVYVVVSMNEEPDMTKLSADRYNIIYI